MKGMDIFCASPASTAICSSIDHRSMVRRSHRTVDHHHHHDHQQSQRDNLLDQVHRRIKNQPRSLHVPCSSSQLPVNPGPYSNNYEKSRKSCSDNYHSKQTSEVRRKSSADIYDLKRRTTSPPGSSRYLLSDSPFVDWLSEEETTGDHEDDHVQRRVVSDRDHQRTAKVNLRSLSTKESSSSNLVRASSSSTRSCHQVVVLRVSLHCKGCEGKVRKHLSKMEGVTSFSIDLAAKKVTVIGDITPLGVLASVSKVKSAQLWPSPTSSSPSSPWSA